MTSSDKGEVTIKDIVKFKKNGYYRIYVEDTSGNESYIQFTVGNVNNDDDDESNVS
jgi:archaellum component FlaG (FlaF/FlaG flagellin family)